MINTQEPSGKPGQAPVEYVRSLYPTMPDLHNKLRGTIAALSERVNEVELPWEVHNDIDQRPISLNADILSAPGDTQTQLMKREDIATGLEAVN
jgi:hypothetical protein